MATANPFDYEHPADETLFVDRVTELRTLTTCCTSNSNAILIAPRRYGKTSLVQETFRRLSRSTCLPLYVDVLDTLSEREVAERILTALAAAVYGKTRRGWERLAIACRRVRPDLMYNVGTQTFAFTIHVAAPSLPSLQDALEALESTARRERKRVILVVDEFQTILERPGMEETVRAMRTLLQQQRHVTYIFSGSKRHTLLGLTRDERQPFYGQLDVVEIPGIPMQEFAGLARRLFARKGLTLSDGVLARVGQTCRDHPKRIQQVLFALYANARPPAPTDVDQAVAAWIAKDAYRFDDELGRVKEGPQKRLLIGLALEGAVKTIYGKDFLHKYEIGTTAHAAKAAAGLQALGVLDHEHRFIDPFFFQHLRLRRSLPLAPVP